MKTNNWHDIYHTMQVGENCYLIASSRKYVSEQLRSWRKRNPEDPRWFRIERAYCRREGMEGMIVTRLPGPSKEKLAAIEFHQGRVQQSGEVATAPAGEEVCYAAV